ncbi:MAG: GntR family transcriptional regulator [bacterium]|nr:GntR family transcriptional regulator [bacterium]
MYRFSLDRASAVPVYKQIEQIVKVEFLSGRLKYGDKLPSIKELSTILKVHPNTIIKVYNILKAEKLITGHVGSGYLMAAKNVELSAFTKAMLYDEFKKFVNAAVSIGAKMKDIKDLMENHLVEESNGLTIENPSISKKKV